MVDAVAPAQFSTINYVKDGEKIAATKQGMTVTLVGDKNGTRQMPMEEFVKTIENRNITFNFYYL